MHRKVTILFLNVQSTEVGATVNLERIFGLLRKDEQSPFPYPHITFVQKCEDLVFKTCSEDRCGCSTKQHCPMCSSVKTGNINLEDPPTSSFAQVNRHMLQYHWNKAVTHKSEL